MDYVFKIFSLLCRSPLFTLLRLIVNLLCIIKTHEFMDQNIFGALVIFVKGEFCIGCHMGMGNVRITNFQAPGIGLMIR